MFIVSRQSQEGAESLLFFTVTPLIKTELANDKSMFSSVSPVSYVSQICTRRNRKPAYPTVSPLIKAEFGSNKAYFPRCHVFLVQ
jgi:hypothetical protein